MSIVDAYLLAVGTWLSNLPAWAQTLGILLALAGMVWAGR